MTYDEDYAIKECAYSIASYCPLKKITDWDCVPCGKYIPKPAQIIPLFNKTGSNVGFIGYDELTKTIKIVFQGTRPWIYKELIDDINIFKIQYPYCPNCKVHQGFYFSYLDLQSQVLNSLDLLRKNYPNASISVTGHSLGAAISVLCAIDLVVN